MTESRPKRMSVQPTTFEEINSSTGLVGVWKEKFSPGQPTYYLLSDGTAQCVKDAEDTACTSGFGKWELSANGQVKVSCEIKKGDPANGAEEHLLSMHCMMFEGVFKRLQELNGRDEERVKKLAAGEEVPKLHAVTVLDAGEDRGFKLFPDEKLSDLKERLRLDPNSAVMVMLGDNEVDESKALCEVVPNNAVLRLERPKPADATTEEPAKAATGEAAPPQEPTPALAAGPCAEKDQISDAFRKWDVTNKGLIQEQDLAQILVTLGVPEGDVSAIFAQANAKKGGAVDYASFINWVYSAEDDQATKS